MKQRSIYFSYLFSVVGIAKLIMQLQGAKKSNIHKLEHIFMLSNCFTYKVVLLFTKFTKLVFSLSVKNNQGYIVQTVL